MNRNDEGMTLIELVVAVLILAIIMAPLLGAIVTSLFSTEQAAHRTANTADQQILASFFSNDVQSSDTVSVPSTPGCGANGTTVVQFNWQDPVGPVDKTVVYVATNNALVRLYCDSAGASKTTTVVGALSATPAATCTTAGSVVPCPSAASKPESVSMTATAIGDTSGASFDTYDIQLSAARRVTA